MAPRRSIREPQLAFNALSIEGGLLGAEWLGTLARLGASAQDPADYQVPKGLEIRDEIARAWRIAQACWGELEAGRTSGADAKAIAERFVVSLLRDGFGFTSIRTAEPLTIAGHVYPVQFFALGDRVPIVIAPVDSGLDEPVQELGDGRRRRSAFGLLQEALNASSAALWGLASDGLTLRLARDNASLTRPAWIEADLTRIFAEGLYPDFAALWLLSHETRFGRIDGSSGTCPLERWREAGREEGTRARDKLREGFEQALGILGQGFLSHPANTGLRSALHGGDLTRDHYFGQLLRFVYRMIFLLTVEERGLLHPKDTTVPARKLYADGYALRRLRDRAIRRSAHDRQSDLWECLKITLRGLATGEPRLGLPALAGLFAPEQCPDLDAAKLENRDLLRALFHLAWLRESTGLVRVNWRDMGPDELGYVYEGLLELVPQIQSDGRSFAFAGESESRGSARKTTGSYYTPDELVQLLLASALDPVVQHTMDAHPEQPADALLELAIVDPACGSGHFLLAAARRLAEHVARLRASGTPTPEDYQHSLRDVVRRCIYGVDLNPLAVELCKVSLWMESIEPGLPLTFLESHIRCGNALLGTTRALMGDKVPGEAWVALEGDDKKLTASLKRLNKEGAEGQGSLALGALERASRLADAMEEVERSSDADASALAEKAQRWQALLASQAYEHEKLIADAWCAAFVWPKEKAGPVLEAAPITPLWRALRDRQLDPPPVLLETTARLASEYGLFHWELAFPQVFARGGFDVVLGNPPWERVKLQEQEFFASREPVIANAQNAAARKKLIAALPTTNPDLWREWTAATRVAQGQSHFARESGRYPLCGKGDVNTYALFAEQMRSVLRPKGAAGSVLPAGIATDDTTKDFFQSLVLSRTLLSLLHFENEERLFAGVNNMTRFVLLTVGGAEMRSEVVDVVAFARNAIAATDPARRYQLPVAAIIDINPNTGTFAPFHSKRDADRNLSMYKRAGVLWREADPDGNCWGVSFMRMFDMANDSSDFRTQGELVSGGWARRQNAFVKEALVMLPLYEAKMLHHFDHRYATYSGATQANLNKGTLPKLSDAQHADPNCSTMPEYWVADSAVAERLDERWQYQWLLGWRDICRSTDHRTVIASLIPRTAVGHQFPIMMPSSTPSLIACLYACLCSLALDYAARQKVGGTHLTYFFLKQLPVLAPATYQGDTPWQRGTMVRDWLVPRVLELTYTAYDLKPFAEDCGDDGAPFIWDSERRRVLRAELDAAFFHLYGFASADANDVMDSFPIVRKHDEAEFGEFRTKRMVIEVYEAMAVAAVCGTPYASPLGPPRRAP